MIQDLMQLEKKTIAGGRFLPGLTRRLNNLCKPLVENGVMRDIGKGFEKAGQVITKIANVKISGKVNDKGKVYGDIQLTTKK